MASNPICLPVASADMIRVQRMFENRERMHKAILRLQPRETFLVRKSQMESCRFCAFAKACAWRIPGGKLFFPLCRKVAKERPVCCRFEAKDSCHSCDMLQAVCISFCSSTFNPIFQQLWGLRLKSCSWWARCGRAVFCSATLASSTSLMRGMRIYQICQRSDAVSHLFWARSRVRLGMGWVDRRRHVFSGLGCEMSVWVLEITAVMCHCLPLRLRCHDYRLIWRVLRREETRSPHVFCWVSMQGCCCCFDWGDCRRATNARSIGLVKPFSGFMCKLTSSKLSIVKKSQHTPNLAFNRVALNVFSNNFAQIDLLFWFDCFQHFQVCLLSRDLQ